MGTYCDRKDNMTEKQKRGSGGQKKVGRDKVKCASYKNRSIREKNKLKKFKKHNLPKDVSEENKKELIVNFRNLQENRKKVKT